MSKCDSCKNKLRTWSEALREEYRGCNLLLKEASEDLTEETISENIESEVLGFGWVSNGHMAFNDQIITKNTTCCKYYERK